MAVFTWALIEMKSVPRSAERCCVYKQGLSSEARIFYHGNDVLPSIFNKELCNKIGIFIQNGLLQSHILLNTMVLYNLSTQYTFKYSQSYLKKTSLWSPV